MKTVEQTTEKLRHLQERLRQVEDAIDRNMKKAWHQRDKGEMRFLLDEKKAWQRAIDCLQWVVEN